jgi:ferrochelatase
VPFDAVLVLSFGGPESPEEVVPFLENVLRGRPVPLGRIDQVAAHYMEFGGRSPINAHNRALVDALGPALAERGLPLPVYWGNRNWHPYLPDTVARMRHDGIRRAAVFVTSAYSSYSGCRQYLDDMAAARRAVGDGAPQLVKLPVFYDRPGFVEPLAAGLRAALATAGPAVPVLMSAHSIPEALAATCDYQKQLTATGTLVAEAAGLATDGWSLVFQSRSGPPAQPWLEPDIAATINGLPPETTCAVVVPVGFVSDHMEVVYDLDRVAVDAGMARGIDVIRTPTPGTDIRFVAMICDLVAESAESPLDCRPGCCPAPTR